MYAFRYIRSVQQRNDNRIRADDRSQLNYILLQVVAFGTAKQVIDWSYFSRIVGCEGWFCFDRQECIFDFDAVLTYLFQVFTPGNEIDVNIFRVFVTGS